MGVMRERPLEASDQEMRLFQQLFYEHVGIHLAESKKPLLCGRLGNRLAELGITRYRDYHELIAAPDAVEERQRAIDLITTNETYFFREPHHFEFMQKEVLPNALPHGFDVWSAACSTGEEPYTIAMLLEALRPGAPWRVVASDISSRVLRYARRGLYPMSRGQKIPQVFLKRHCLKGIGEYQGYFLVERALRERVEFKQINLTEAPRNTARFDVIFLRNVLIYFDRPTKQKVLAHVTSQLRPGGWLFVGHSESMNGLLEGFESWAPSIHRKPLP